MIAGNTKSIHTRKTRILYIISILVIGALLLVLFLRSSNQEIYIKKYDNYEAILVVGGIRIPITIANTDAEKQLGLSGTASLPINQGKLFVFNSPSKPGFWMKDMNYGLDLIWLDENLRIVDITKDIYPESYPKVFYPKENVLYVLEVNAGFSKKHNLVENQLMYFSDNLSF